MVQNQVSFYVTRVGKSEDHSSLKPSIIQLSYISKVIKHFAKSNNLLFDYNYLTPSIKELLKFKSLKYDVIIIREPNKLMGLIYFLWSKLIGVNIIACLCLETNFEASFPEKKSLPFNCFRKILQTPVRDNIKAKNQMNIPKK